MSKPPKKRKTAHFCATYTTQWLKNHQNFYTYFPKKIFEGLQFHDVYIIIIGLDVR